RVGHVEAVEHGIARIAADEDVNTAAVSFAGLGVHLPAAAWRGHACGQFGENAPPTPLRVEHSGDGPRGCAEYFPREPLPWIAPEQFVVRIDLRCRFPVGRGLLVSTRSHDQPMQGFQTPAAPDELTGQPVEQFRMRGPLALQTKIAWRGD